MHKYTPQERIDTFWNTVAIDEADFACWNWTQYLGKRRYGQLRVNGKKVFAHRFAYELAFGEIPSGFSVCHHCDNPPCCNPNHLFLGTVLDNIRDRDNKLRGVQLRGEQHGLHKLTWTQVDEIRKRYARGNVTAKALGNEFGVSKSTILSVIHYKTWTTLPPSHS